MSFTLALNAAGLRPRDVIADGRIRRCPTETHLGKRNGWHVLHPDGHGLWGDWASGSGAPLGTWQDEHSTAVAPSPQVLAQQQRQRERDRAWRAQAIGNARRHWADSRPLDRPHPYIEQKGLSPLGCAGLRTNGGLLVVPVMVGDALVSVQTIAPDGEKRFWPGAPVKAGAYVLARPRAALTCIVEGLATGLAVYQALPNATVIVAFDAGNLQPVVDRIRPTGSVVIAADNDHKTFARTGVNPGLDKARNAAELIGCGVAWPQGLEGTDYADMAREFGAGAARRIEREILAAARFVMA